MAILPVHENHIAAMGQQPGGAPSEVDRRIPGDERWRTGDCGGLRGSFADHDHASHKNATGPGAASD